MKETQIDFNFDSLISPSVNEFLNAVNVYPVLSDKIVVKVEDFDNYFLNGDGLLSYLDSPFPTSVVIFYSRYQKINLKNKEYFRLSKIRLLYDNELFPYIKNLSKEKGIKLSDDSVHYIIRYTGNNTLSVDN